MRKRSVVGLISLMQTNPTTPSFVTTSTRVNSGVWGNGTSIDSDNDSWGTVSMYFRVFFPLNTSPTTYTFNVNMESWLKADLGFGRGITSRFWGMSSVTQLQFIVT